MTMTTEFWLQVVLALASGFGAYAAIRADLATLHERTKNLQGEIDRANERMSDLFDRRNRT